MSVFNIITNTTNGAGLQRDAELFKKLLEQYGHKVVLSMFNVISPEFRRYDVNVFMEVVRPEWLQFGKENWLIPNSEWWYPCWEGTLRCFTKVLCKTHDCLRLWEPKMPGKCVYTGWESSDFYNPNVKKKRVFLHLAGKSETKNTAAVMEAWKQYRISHPLIVSAFKPEIVKLTKGVPNVTQIERFSPEETVRMLNECAFHIMPSKNEGYGHAIHEALACRGTVITTGAPPMSEFHGINKNLLISVANVAPRMMTKFYEVSPTAVANTVNLAWQLTDSQLETVGDAARAGFLEEREYFRGAMKQLLEGR